MKRIESLFEFYDGRSLDKDDIVNLYRLQMRLLVEENLIATFEECINIWGRYSDDLCAEWLFFPANDADILTTIKSSNFFDSFENYSKEL